MADPNAVQESYPTQTVGTGIPEWIHITTPAADHTITYPNTPWVGYLTVSRASATPQVQLFAEPQDSTGQGCGAGPITWKSYGASPTSFASADPSGTWESYPVGGNSGQNPPQEFAGGCTVDSLGNLSVTAEGHYWVEARCVSGTHNAGGLDGSANTKSSIAYGMLLVKVVA